MYQLSRVCGKKVNAIRTVWVTSHHKPAADDPGVEGHGRPTSVSALTLSHSTIWSNVNFFWTQNLPKISESSRDDELELDFTGGSG